MLPKAMLLITLVVLTTAGTAATSLNYTDSLTLQTLLTWIQHHTTMLEQQGAAILSLQSQTAKLLDRNYQQTQDMNSIQTNVTEVKKQADERLGAFKAQLETRAKVEQVAFTVHMSNTSVDVGASNPFIFDAVTTNIGDAYNPQSGIFVAPQGGIYVFNFMMINDGAADSIQAQIEMNGKVLGVGTSDKMGENNKWDDGSALVTTHLKAGDRVYVKRRGGGTRVYGGVYTNFSGFLLSADA